MKIAARWIAGVSIASLLALAGCQKSGGGAIGGAAGTSPEQRLARSLGIIRTATPDSPKTLKLLFYGQSISQPKWTDRAVAHLRATYPNVRFVVRNMAIGGFDDTRLEHTTERDVTEFYPDLIVFHVYGDHRSYERIIRLMRARTAAEIIIQDDHVVEPIEPPCDEGLHLTLHAPPGCKGRLWYKQKNWSDHMSWRVLPDLADRYGLALERRRALWSAYLHASHLAPEALLADLPHPNDRGWRLMAHLFDAYFDRRAARWNGETQSLVTDRPLPAGDAVTIPFTGNRLELIASVPLDGKVDAKVDGKAPRDIDGCWQTSRTSSPPNYPPWPTIRHVDVDPSFHRAETWTATVTKLNPDQSDFAFALTGQATGPDGSGSGTSDFVSPSGRIRIAKADWVLAEARQLTGKGVPEGLRVQWRRFYQCGDEVPVQLLPGRQEVRYVVATGLANGRHEATIRLSPEARAHVLSVRAYAPPLTTP